MKTEQVRTAQENSILAAWYIASAIWRQFANENYSCTNQSLEGMNEAVRSMLVQFLKDAGCTVEIKLNQHTQVKGMRLYITVQRPANYKPEVPWKIPQE